MFSLFIMLRNYSVSQSGKYWIWSMFYSLLFLFVYGYKFNCSDLEEHLPAVYKMLNPHLYHGDYVTEFLASDFSVRYFYNHTLYYPGLVFSLSTVAFTLMLMLLTVFTYYMQKTSFVIFKNHITASITPFIAIILLNKITIGGNTVSDNMLTCTVFANTMCMAAFYYGLSSRLRIAALCCGLATWYQPLIGMQVFLLLMLMHSVINKFRLKEIGITIIFYFLKSALQSFSTFCQLRLCCCLYSTVSFLLKAQHLICFSIMYYMFSETRIIIFLPFFRLQIILKVVCRLY